MLAMRLAITSAMINITASHQIFNRDAKVNRGGTKKKSEALPPIQ